MNGLPTESLPQSRENFLARQKTEEAQNELALHAMHEAIPYARKVCRGALPDDELFSLCWAALLKAAKQFKANSARFFAYAKVSVRRGICDAWREKDVVKNSSVNETMDYPAPLKLFEYESTRQEGCHADGDYAENLVYAGHSTPYFGELGTSVEPEIDKIDTAAQWKVVEPIMRSKLSKTEFMTLDLHYRGDMNFQEIADILGVVREATRLAHIRALKKIRCEMRRQKALL